jgi:hypothetical protein
MKQALDRGSDSTDYYRTLKAMKLKRPWLHNIAGQVKGRARVLDKERKDKAAKSRKRPRDSTDESDDDPDDKAMPPPSSSSSKEKKKQAKDDGVASNANEQQKK